MVFGPISPSRQSQQPAIKMAALMNTLQALITVTFLLGYVDCLQDELRSQQQRINWLLTSPDPFMAALLQSTTDEIERDFQKRYKQFEAVQRKLDEICLNPPVQGIKHKEDKEECEVCGGSELVKNMNMLCRSFAARTAQLEENRVLFGRVKRAKAMEVKAFGE